MSLFKKVLLNRDLLLNQELLNRDPTVRTLKGINKCGYLKQLGRKKKPT